VSDFTQSMSTTARRRRAFLVATAGVLLPFVVADALLFPGLRIAAVVAMWLAALLVGALLQHPRHPLACTVGVILATVASLASSLAMIVMTGGSTSVLFSLLVALPPCVALYFPELPAVAVGAAVVSIGSGATICLREGRSWLDVGYLIAVSIVVDGSAISAAALVRRNTERELARERERSQELEALANAERERLQLERLAEVGRLAAAVAHEVSGPLSAIRSNLACLLRDPELAEPDRRAALLDTHAAVEQVIEIIERVRTVMWQEGRPASPE
jgi:two-component system, NtrC family, sensor kinase